MKMPSLPRTGRGKLAALLLILASLMIVALMALQYRESASTPTGSMRPDVLARFIDPAGDDNGAGALTYPSNAAFRGGAWLDLLSYTVYRPVTGIFASRQDEYWELEFGFAALGNPLGGVNGFTHPVIHVYLDLDGDGKGSVETATGRSELVRFPAEYPWDVMVRVDGFRPGGSLVAADGRTLARVAVSADAALKRITVRIPMARPLSGRAIARGITRHYVLVGAFDPYTSGTFMQVRDEADTHHGGGAASRLTPRVFDCILPPGYDQKTVLSSFEERGLRYALVYPVAAGNGSGLPEGPAPGLMEQFEKLADGDKERERREALAKCRARGADLDRGIACFRGEEYGAARERLDAALARDRGNPRALAYSGALRAASARDELSPFAKLTAVNEAFGELDRAVQTASGEDLVHALLNRGHVCMEIPESIFHKNLQGAADFLKAAAIFERMGGAAPAGLLTDCYLNAARCYRQTGDTARAQAYYGKAMSRGNLSAAQKLALMKQGYYDRRFF